MSTFLRLQVGNGEVNVSVEGLAQPLLLGNEPLERLQGNVVPVEADHVLQKRIAKLEMHHRSHGRAADGK